MKPNKFIKRKLEIDSADNFNWDPLDIGAFLKEELRNEHSEIHIINSYMHAIETIYKTFNKESNPLPHMKLFYNNNLGYPFLYLCRHTLELSIKYLLNKKNITLDTHNLKSLWELLNVDSLKKNKDYKQLIALFEIVDNDGTKLRYVKNTKNEIQHKNPFFIRTKDICITTIQLCKDLLKIDLKELN